MRRLIALGFLLICLLLYAALVTIAPIIGLSKEYDWILFRTIASRSVVLSYPLGLSFLVVVYALLGIGVEAPARGARFVAVLKSAWADGAIAARELLNCERSRGAHEVSIMTAAIVAIGAAFALFYWKFSNDLSTYHQYWYQAFVDYDIDWGTPIFALGANVLYHFGIQLPLNTHLLPLERLAHAFPLEHRIMATVSLCFLSVGGLFFAVGSAIGLRPIPRTIFAGAVALLITIPRGIDPLIWLLPPDFFTSQFKYALWWLEAPILFLTTVFLFFWLGQRQSLWGNVAIGAGFAAGSFAIVLSYPAGAIYFVPLTTLYCLGFALSCESRRELVWKSGVSAGLISLMFIARIPQFFIGLYSYTFGSYFFELLQQPTSYLIKQSFMVSYRGGVFDFRRMLVFLLSMGILVVAATVGKMSVRRIAIAALICEGGIIIIGLANALIFGAPMAIAYAEIAHAPVWAAYFILFCMIMAVVVDRRLVHLAGHADGKFSHKLAVAVFHRRTIYLAGLLVIMTAIGALPVRSNRTPYPYQPAPPAPLELAARELAITPGGPFRGRLLNAGFSDERLDMWIAHLRTDLFIDPLAISIPVVNEYGHWTSPVNFVFLRAFFGQRNDSFSKLAFPLTTFDLRGAQLMGVRLVASDGEEIPGGSLLYESKAGDSNLRIFRIDDVNLGQYSPTRPRRVYTATEAIAEMRASGFDPKRDVLVEDSVPSGLVPATSAKVIVDLGPKLVVKATAPGYSLLVLPFEYSHCLRLEGSNDKTRLMPVNLQQTGLLFEGALEASIEYRFGLFGDSTCRGKDVQRANVLKVNEAIRG